MDDEIDFYETALHLLSRGHFVVIGMYEDRISLRYIHPTVLDAKGLTSKLMSPNDMVRIPHLFATAHEVIEAGEERFNEHSAL